MPKQSVLDSGVKFECGDMFHDLDVMINSFNRAELDTRMIMKCAWNGFKQLRTIISPSLKTTDGLDDD